jgi:hypothetical protein
MAEVLIHDEIRPDQILGVICSTHSAAAWVRDAHNIYAVCDPRFYF